MPMKTFAMLPAILILLAALPLPQPPAQAQAQAQAQTDAQRGAEPRAGGSSGREPSVQELGETMGQAMGQMGRMMGDMAQTMGSAMQRMLEAVQKEGLNAPKNEHIEGKLAFVKAELRIAPAQEQAWTSFADAMRRAAAAQPAGATGGGATLPERLDRRTQQLAGRLAALQAKKAAIDALYRHLDESQKTLADDLIEQIGLV